MRFACPTCHAVMSAPDSAAGKKGSCPSCRQRLQIPGAPPRRPTVLGRLLPDPGPAVIPASLATARPHSSEEVDVTPAEGSQPVSRWWRPASPSMLLLALIVFPLPWIEVRCSGGGELGGKVLFSQSGLQAIYGGASLNPVAQAKREEELKARKPGSPDVTFAPCMALFPCFLLAGALVGFGLRLGTVRRAALGLLASGALVALLAQVALGFPLENETKRGAAEIWPGRRHGRGRNRPRRAPPRLRPSPSRSITRPGSGWRSWRQWPESRLCLWSGTPRSGRGARQAPRSPNG